MGEPAKEFAQQLRSLRVAQGLSVRALADLVGVSKVTIWKWEKGDNEPQARLIPPLARALNIPPVELGLPDKITGMSLERSDAGVQSHIDIGARGQAEALSDVIAKAKQLISDVTGVGPKNITITIEY